MSGLSIFMSLIMLLLGLPLSTCSSASENSIELLPADNEIPAYVVEGKHTVGPWMSVRDGNNGSDILVPITLRVSTPSCDSGSTGRCVGEETVKLSWTPPGEARFLVRGLELDSRKPITRATGSIDCLLSKIGDTCSLGLGGKEFMLRITGKPGPSVEAVPQEFSILLESAGRSQALWELHRDSKGLWDDPHFSLTWAGDLDQDGKLDLVMILSAKYSSLPSILFLSSKADSGELAHRVAEYKVED